MKIIVLKGGNSPEREVSLVSGREIALQLKQNGHEVHELDPADYQTGWRMLEVITAYQPDVVFNGLHGGSGENGMIQAMLAYEGIACTGPDYKTCAVAMDKYMAKCLAAASNVPVAKDMLLYKNRDLPSYRDCLTAFPNSVALVVKPVDAGSSVGVHIVKDEAGFIHACKDAFLYTDIVLVEEFIAGRELTVTVIDGTAYPVVEIQPHDGWYDYTNKYTKGNTTYTAPAELSVNQSKQVTAYALMVWEALQIRGYSRIDFRYDGDEFYFLEVNTLPGMTPLSLTPMAAKAAGMSFGELLEAIIRTAITHK